MTYKTFVTLSLILIIIAGIGAWYVWRSESSGPAPSASPVTHTSTSTSSGTSNIVSPQITKADADRLYTSLLSNLSASQVSFVRVSTSADPKFGSLYALYGDDISQSKIFFPKQTNFSVGAALVDLNLDGTPEAIVYEDLPGFCGSAGCPLDVYKKNGTSWQKVLNVLAYDTLGVSDAKTNGYKNLLVSIQGDVGFMTTITRFTWDGSAYQQGAVVATWDGAKFMMSQ